MSSAARPYGITLFALVVAVFVRWLLDPILGDHLAFVTLYVALAVAAWYGGLKPTLVVVVLGGLIAAYAFIPPRGSIEIALPLHRFQLISYMMAGIVIGLFGEAARVAQRRAEAKAEETRQKQVELAAEIAVRKQLEEQLKQRNEELQHANRNKDRFMAFLGHELRNPLTAIHATLEALHVEQPVEGRLERHFQLMARQAHSLSRMVEDLFDISRITRGTVDLRSRPVDAALALHDAVESVQPIIHVRQHELTLVPAESELWVNADPIRLEQILSNLLHNAAKYTDAGGRIWARAEQDGQEAVLRIRDSGRGIAEHDLARIFEPFVQLDPLADRAHGGMGLGLALVKKLVEMHGGKIAAFSAGPGKGSEFVIRLPLLAREARTVAASPRRQARPRILLVDDHEDIARSMGELLTQLGYDVRVASEGEEALQAAADFLPDAVLLDIGLPGMDGYEVARRLRQEPRFQHALLVAITGYGIEGDETAARAAGFDRQLVKPVRSADVQQVLVQLH
jgi:signal transduction histidine kinase/CheY-like chemotaxis protein